jgi:DNA-binding transcriptional MerR regulator
VTGLSIGAVIALLHEEFPDVTVSKIRYLENEGLIAPERTSTGYRRFSQEDVGRLLYILRAQRDRYLPLKVIRDELAAVGSFTDLAPYPQQDSLPIDTEEPLDDAERFTAAALRRLTRATQTLLDDVRAHGLIDDEPYDACDVAVVRAAVKLTELGLEVRHLRMYRQFNERELDVVQQLLAPALRHTEPKRLDAAATQAQDILHWGDALHQALRDRELRILFRS